MAAQTGSTDHQGDPGHAVTVLRSLGEVERWLAAQARRDSEWPRELARIGVDAALALFPGDAEARRLIALSARLDIPLLIFDPMELPANLPVTIPPAVARRLEALPLATTEAFAAVAMGDPHATAPLEFLLGRHVLPVLAKPGLIARALARQADRSEDESLIATLGLDPAHRTGEGMALVEAERVSGQQPLVKLVAEAIEGAIRRRASDVHIRPGPDSFELLFRIDGDMVPIRRFLPALLPAVVSRIKVLGGMNIAEHRLPQDGRATASVDGKDVDLRISVIPTIHGEAVVMRVLDSAFGLRSVSEIGFGQRDEALFRDVLARSQGLVLVTGPTGSGKSTTLYAALLECRKQNVNIITVEDPVEAKIDDVLQVQINRAAGLTFARTLRNILRHDPDVVMIGEIRDRETAEIAVESALTGHLVLSTLHTNNAATTITRLLDLGVQPFLLKSTLLAVLAQRLARRNCQHCRVEEPADAHMRARLGVRDSERFIVGKGCERCEGRGVKGRIGIYELLEVTPELGRLIVAEADATAIHRLAVEQGMTTITGNAVSFARAGVISLQEAFAVRVD